MKVKTRGYRNGSASVKDTNDQMALGEHSCTLKLWRSTQDGSLNPTPKQNSLLPGHGGPDSPKNMVHLLGVQYHFIGQTCYTLLNGGGKKKKDSP